LLPPEFLTFKKIFFKIPKSWDLNEVKSKIVGVPSQKLLEFYYVCKKKKK